MGPDPGRFEPSKGISEANISNGSGIRDPQFEILRVEVMRTDRIRSLAPRIILRVEGCPNSTANLRTKILDFRGFVPSRILILRGGILLSIRNLTETSSQGVLAGIINLSREIGRALRAVSSASPEKRRNRGRPEERGLVERASASVLAVAFTGRARGAL